VIVACPEEAGERTSSLVVLRWDGERNVARTALPLGIRLAAVALKDLNGDGRLDVIATDLDDGQVIILRGSGAGTFGPTVPSSVDATGPAALAAQDLDGDGVMDLVTANSLSGDVSILYGSREGTFRVTGPPYPAGRLALHPVP
jgi:hypothetical protein